MARHGVVTDELPDRVLFRPLAAFLVRPLAGTFVTPNQITGLAALCGIASGVAVGLGSHAGFTALLGAGLLLDCADGQLARLRGGGTVWGRIVDGLGDYATASAVHVGLIVLVSRDVGWVLGTAWGLAAGAGMGWHSFLMDKYKRRFRGNVDDLGAVRRERDAASGLKRFFLGGFLPYAAAVNRGPRIADRDAYRDRTWLPMIVWLWLGPTTHYTLAAILVAFGRPLLYLQVAAVPLSLLALLNLVWQRRLESRAPPVVGSVDA